MRNYKKFGVQVATGKLLPMYILDQIDKKLFRCLEASLFLKHFLDSDNKSAPVQSEVRGIIHSDGSAKFALVNPNGSILGAEQHVSSQKVQQRLFDRLVYNIGERE